MRSPFPRLYRQVNVRLWIRHDTARFLKCSNRSGGRCLKYTKELIVEDERTTEEHYASHFGAITVLFITVPGHDIVPPERRDSYLATILQMIPADNNLLRFRYFPSLSFSNHVSRCDGS
jgi:hypothetical protein